MSPILALALLVVAGALAARVDWRLPRAPSVVRALVGSGAPLILAGVLIGPLADLLPSAPVLAPVPAFATGWLGMLFGLRLDRALLRRSDSPLWRFVLLQGILVFLLVLIGAAALRHLIPGLAERWAPPRAAVLSLAAAAAISVPPSASVAARLLGLRGSVRDLLAFGAAMNTLIAVLAFAVTFAAYHPAEGTALGALGAGPSLAATMLAGVLAGAAFLAISGKAPTPGELTLCLTGTVLLATGAATVLGLSPLVITVVAGATAANLARRRRRILATLLDWERPVCLALLVFAGTGLGFPGLWAALAIVLFAGWRLAAAYVSGSVASRLLGLAHVPAGIGLGLATQGGLALALGVDYLVTYSRVAPAAAVSVFTTVAALVVLSQLASPEVLRRALLAPLASPRGPLTGGGTEATVPAGED